MKALVGFCTHAADTAVVGMRIPSKKEGPLSTDAAASLTSIEGLGLERPFVGGRIVELLSDGPPVFISATQLCSVKTGLKSKRTGVIGLQ